MNFNKCLFNSIAIYIYIYIMYFCFYLLKGYSFFYFTKINENNSTIYISNFLLIDLSKFDFRYYSLLDFTIYYLILNYISLSYIVSMKFVLIH